MGRRVYVTNEMQYIPEFYGLSDRGCLTMMYKDKTTFLVGLKDRMRHEVTYPLGITNFPLRISETLSLATIDQIVNNDPSVRNLDEHFYHILIKILTATNVSSSILVTLIYGFFFQLCALIYSMLI